MATGLCGNCGGSTPGCGCYLTAGEGLVIVGDGSVGNPFTPTVKNRAQFGNPIRNASGAVAQRGASVAVGGGGPTLDAWWGIRSGAVAGETISQQSVVDLVGAVTAIRVQRDSGNSATNRIYLQQALPSVAAKQYAGRQLTLSFRARKLANYSAASSALTVSVNSHTLIDQQYPSSFGVNVVSSTVTLTSNFQTFSVTFTPGSSATQFGPFWYYDPTGTAGALDAFEIKDVRIDEGPYALAHIPLPYAFDLLECRRFFRRYGGAGSFDIHGIANIRSSTLALLWIPFGSGMHAPPTLTVGAAGGLIVDEGPATSTSTAIALSGLVVQTADGALVQVTCGGGGLTAGRSAVVYTSGTAANGVLNFSAEI